MQTWLHSLLLTLCTAGGLAAQTLVVSPYLQNASPHAMWVMWETSAEAESRVEWGPSPTLGQVALGTSETGAGASRIHQVELDSLQPATRYYYRITVGNLVTPTYDFVTPPAPEAEQSFNLVAMSDMQRDGANPDIFRQICEDGIIRYVQDQYGSADLPAHLGMALIPGDLVENGNTYSQWANHFFAPSAALFRHIPVFPVAGNHENDSPNYFKYFHLPDNGSPGFAEHWWYADYSNVRIIGLESNTGYRLPAQLNWLQGVLDDACASDHIDFVFAQLHHPYHSELWIAGNTTYTGDVISLLENFSTQCGKPSVHFFGHTHGYSRGQSRDHTHLMVNVASAGGNIDSWGEYAQNDYPEYTVSHDDYGFVWLEIQAGDDPQFLLKRISRGSPANPLDNVLRDSIRISFHDPAPQRPEAVFPPPFAQLRPDCILFKASPFADPGGDLHGATHWQIALDSTFENLVYDELKSHQNWYNNADTQAGDDLTDEEVSLLEPFGAYYWRVRYRDRRLSWSAWSEVTPFQTTASSLTPNLLHNPGAEDGVEGWTLTSGIIESILSSECAGNQAYAGDRLFAVGGVCEEYPYGEAFQDIDLTPYANDIAQGGVEVHYGGFLSDYNGADRPEFRLDFLDQQGTILGSTPVHGIQSPIWTLFDERAELPDNVAQLRLVLMGTRNAGVDNDSYFDQMSVRLNLQPGECEQASPTGEVSPPANLGVLRLYPNPAPAGHPVQWQLPAEWAGQRCRVSWYDATGRRVRVHIAEGASGQLDTRGLPPGLYLLRVRGLANETHTYREAIGRLVVE